MQHVGMHPFVGARGLRWMRGATSGGRGAVCGVRSVRAPGEATPVSAEEFDQMMENCFAASACTRFYRRGERYSAFAPRLVVATSGGPDSTGLLMLANAWVRNRGRGSVESITFDHGLRPESAEEAQRVAGWVTQRGIPHHVVKLDLGVEFHDDASRPVLASEAGKRRGVQLAARNARYQALASVCSSDPRSIVLLGHTLSDDLETFVMRLFRLSGVQGLGSMRPVSLLRGLGHGSSVHPLWRPLLGVPKARLEATCAAFLQPHVTDPSNSTLAYDRNRVRAALAAAGCGTDRPEEEMQLVVAAQAAREAAGLVQRAALRGLAACADFDEQLNAWRVDAAGMRRHLPDAAAFAEAWALVTATVGGGEYRPPGSSLSALHAAIVDPSAATGIAPAISGCELHVSGDELTVVRTAKNRRHNGGVGEEDASVLRAADARTRGQGRATFAGLWVGMFEVGVEDVGGGGREAGAEWEYAVTSTTNVAWAATRRALAAKYGRKRGRAPRLPPAVRRRLACVIRWRRGEGPMAAEVVAVPQARLQLVEGVRAFVRPVRAVSLAEDWREAPGAASVVHCVVVERSERAAGERVVPSGEWAFLDAP